MQIERHFSFLEWYVSSPLPVKQQIRFAEVELIQARVGESAKIKIIVEKIMISATLRDGLSKIPTVGLGTWKIPREVSFFTFAFISYQL